MISIHHIIYLKDETLTNFPHVAYIKIRNMLYMNDGFFNQFLRFIIIYKYNFKQSANKFNTSQNCLKPNIFPMSEDYFFSFNSIPLHK